MRYLAGYALAGAAGALATALAPGSVQREIGFGVVVGLVLQGPLGWWAVSALGTDRFMIVWGAGMLMRVTVLVLVALVALPALGWSAGWAAAPALLSLVATMMAMLAVEAVTAMKQNSRRGPTRAPDGNTTRGEHNA